MALEDRERNFEKALGQQLRANAGAGLDCPDAETLAAYHERILSTEEMASLKSHIAACPSCQEVLSTLEVTEAIPAGEEDSERVVAGKARGVVSFLRAEPVFSKSLEMAAPAKGSALRRMPKRNPYMKWIVPAGAIAAGLLVWVAMNESWNKQKTASKTVVQVAENREWKDSVPAASNGDLETRIPAAKAAEKTLQAENERAKQSSEIAELDLENRNLGRKRVNSANAPSHGPAMMQNQVQNQIQNNGNLNQSQAYEFRGQNQQPPTIGAPRTNAPVRSEAKSQVAAAPPLPAPAAAASGPDNVVADRKDTPVGAVSQTAEVAGAAPAVSLDKNKEEVAAKEADKLAVNDGSYQDLQKVGGNAADAAATATKEKKAAEAGRMHLKKADTGFASGAMTSAALRDADEFRASVVRTPDAKVFWVISREGEVFRSEDAGKSSRKQEIGAGTKAIAGSATDAKVCWILAEKGIVARTGDGGQHWVTANVPAGLPFTTITALDATHAIVSHASGKLSYFTADGGATWNVMTQ
jgi:hypothetical protein